MGDLVTDMCSATLLVQGQEPVVIFNAESAETRVCDPLKRKSAEIQDIGADRAKRLRVPLATIPEGQPFGHRLIRGFPFRAFPRKRACARFRAFRVKNNWRSDHREVG